MRSRELLGDRGFRVGAERGGDGLPANARRFVVRSVDRKQWRVLFEALLDVERTTRVDRNWRVGQIWLNDRRGAGSLAGGLATGKPGALSSGRVS